MLSSWPLRCLLRSSDNSIYIDITLIYIIEGFLFPFSVFLSLSFPLDFFDYLMYTEIVSQIQDYKMADSGSVASQRVIMNYKCIVITQRLTFVTGKSRVGEEKLKNTGPWFHLLTAKIALCPSPSSFKFSTFVNSYVSFFLAHLHISEFIREIY